MSGVPGGLARAPRLMLQDCGRRLAVRRAQSDAGGAPCAAHVRACAVLSGNTVEAAAVMQATGVPAPGEQGRAVTAANRAAARDATRQGASGTTPHARLCVGLAGRRAAARAARSTSSPSPPAAVWLTVLQRRRYLVVPKPGACRTLVDPNAPHLRQQRPAASRPSKRPARPGTPASF